MKVSYLVILSAVCLHFAGSSCGLEIFSAAAIGQPERLGEKRYQKLSLLWVVNFILIAFGCIELIVQLRRIQ